MSSSLLRYRSAPSMVLGEMMMCEDFLPVRPSSPETETETVFSRFMQMPEIREKTTQFAPPTIERRVVAEEIAAAQQQIYHSHHQMPSDTSNLIRHSSSPAGLFSQLNVENGYAMMRGMDGLRIGHSGSMGGGGRLKGQISFSPEMGMSGSWDDSSELLPDSLSGLKRPGDVVDVAAGLNQSEAQFQDSVLCKMRAKRGCATHPRSIAERVRRTRISERMRKLQELVPNMDKQTNTADMLDLAVEYIKDLQGQVKTIRESRASCTCSFTKRSKHY